MEAGTIKLYEIIRLYLEKLESLNQKEREIIMTSIDMLNHPILITNPPLN